MDNENILNAPKYLNNPSFDSRRKDAFYTLIIEADPQEENSVPRYFPLDLVTSVNISASSQITEYPLLTGDVLSDHKYDQPEKVSIQGKFSNQGKFANSDQFGDRDHRMRNIQEFFKYVRKRGLSMSLVFGFENDNVFSEMKNLVISDYSFSPHLNSMDFSLSLTAVYYFAASEDDIQPDAITGPDISKFASFKVANFVDDVFSGGNEGQFEYAITKKLNDMGCINPNFGEVLVDVGMAVSAAGITVVIVAMVVQAINAALINSIAILTGVTAGATATAALGPVGWIVLGVTAIATIGYCIFKAIKRNKLRNTYVYFEDLHDKDLNNAETMKFYRLLSNAKNCMNAIANNNNIICYSIPSNDEEQHIYQTLGSDIYRFDVNYVKGSDIPDVKIDPNTLSNKDREIYEKYPALFKLARSGSDLTGNYWQLKVFIDNDVGSANEEDNGVIVPIKGSGKMIGIPSVLDAKKNDVLFYTNDHGYQVYLINSCLTFQEEDKNTVKDMLWDYLQKGKLTTLGLTEEMQKEFVSMMKEELGENEPNHTPIGRAMMDLVYDHFMKYGLYQDITKYYFVVVPISYDLEKFNNEFMENLDNVFKREAYE